MVRGLDLFREHFKDFADRYVLTIVGPEHLVPLKARA